jgi:NitT/TauT family transport system ATP-binding protein
MVDAAVSCESVGHAFRSANGEARPVLEGLNLTIRPGEFVSLLGASGSGKSTALRLIAGLIQPERGAIRVFGRPVEGSREDVALMFQRAALFPWYDALGNVTFPAAYRNGRVDTADLEKARGLLRIAGLEGREKAKPDELSGGMQQRVALCRALFVSPRLVLLDEPFSALDEQLRESLAVEVASLLQQERCTALLVTHSVTEAVLLSDRVIVLGGSPATVVGTETIDIPRPRTLATLDDEAFLRHAKRLRQIMRSLAPERA